MKLIILNNQNLKYNLFTQWEHKQKQYVYISVRFFHNSSNNEAYDFKQWKSENKINDTMKKPRIHHEL